jgi:RIO kinase 1
MTRRPSTHDSNLSWDENREAFQDRGHRHARKPPRRRSVAALLSENQTDYKVEEHVKFDDPGLQELFERGLILELLWELKSGKEATVYVVEGKEGLAAAKLYIDSRVRSFKNDSLYRGSRFIDDKRIRKAIELRSNTGIQVQNILWVQEEFSQMHALQNAGVPVPHPIALSEAGNVILMEFIGNENGAAPRLSDAKLSKAAAEEAFKQSVHNMGLILGAGRVHGDYSTFNILWWQERCIVIDFPQVVLVQENPSANMILERDVAGLCRSFGHFGLHPDPVETLKQVRKVAREIQVAKPSEELALVL